MRRTAAERLSPSARERVLRQNWATSPRVGVAHWQRCRHWSCLWPL